MRVTVCLSTSRSKNELSKFHQISNAPYLWPWLGSAVVALCTFCFVDDVMFVHNRPDKGDASRASTQSESPGAAPDRGRV